MCSAGEPPIRDEADTPAQPGADERRGRCQHLAHPRPTLGSLVANHHDVAGVNRTGQNRRETGLLRVEHTRGTGDFVRAVAADLRDCPLGRQVAAQDHDVPLRAERPVPRMDHILIGRRARGHVFQHVGDGPAIDRERVAVQHPIGEEDLQHLRNPAGAMQVSRDIPTRWLQVAKHGHARADGFEIVDGERHAGRARDGQQMQHGVRRPADRHHHGDRILECLARQDLARRTARAHGVEQHLRRASRTVGRLLVLGRHRRGARQTHPHRFE